jgi:hypothetical protein
MARRHCDMTHHLFFLYLLVKDMYITLWFGFFFGVLISSFADQCDKFVAGNIGTWGS